MEGVYEYMHVLVEARGWDLVSVGVLRWALPEPGAHWYSSSSPPFSTRIPGGVLPVTPSFSCSAKDPRPDFAYTPATF